MQTHQLLSASLIDIIFDGRNKSYGAYELRKTYEKRIRAALFITLLLTVIGIASAVWVNSIKKTTLHYRISDGIQITEIPVEKEPEKLPEPERTKPPEQEIKTQAFVNNLELVEQPQTPPPSQHDLTNAKVDTETREGKPFEGEVDPGPGDIAGKTGIIEDNHVKETSPAETVDIDAKFDGDWKRFLEKNLDGNVPVTNNAPPGRYSVVIRFVVDTDGSISEITPLTQHGYGLEEEGVRVIKKAKKWQPALLNGYHVKAYRKQVIVFLVEEE